MSTIAKPSFFNSAVLKMALRTIGHDPRIIRLALIGPLEGWIGYLDYIGRFNHTIII
jgi:hypothetical protein